MTKAGLPQCSRPPKLRNVICIAAAASDGFCVKLVSIRSGSHCEYFIVYDHHVGGYSQLLMTFAGSRWCNKLTCVILVNLAEIRFVMPKLQLL